MSPNQTRWKLIAVRQPPVIVYISLSAAFSIICQHTVSACSSDAYFSWKSTLNNAGSSKKLMRFLRNSIKSMTCGFLWIILIGKTSSVHLLFIGVLWKDHYLYLILRKKGRFYIWKKMCIFIRLLMYSIGHCLYCTIIDKTKKIIITYNRLMYSAYKHL